MYRKIIHICFPFALLALFASCCHATELTSTPKLAFANSAPPPLKRAKAVEFGHVTQNSAPSKISILEKTLLELLEEKNRRNFSIWQNYSGKIEKRSSSTKALQRLFDPLRVVHASKISHDDMLSNFLFFSEPEQVYYDNMIVAGLEKFAKDKAALEAQNNKKGFFSKFKCCWKKG